MKVYKFNSKRGSSLSNFFPCELYVFNMRFSSAEQAYQYKKADFLGNDKIANEIMSKSKSIDCYFTGKQLGRSSRWDSVKYRYMKKILWAKFKCCKPFRRELINTKEATLVEDTPNFYWGRGMHNNGLNTLGLLLMKLRHSAKA